MAKKEPEVLGPGHSPMLMRAVELGRQIAKDKTELAELAKTLCPMIKRLPDKKLVHRGYLFYVAEVYDRDADAYGAEVVGCDAITTLPPETP